MIMKLNAMRNCAQLGQGATKASSKVAKKQKPWRALTESQIAEIIHAHGQGMFARTIAINENLGRKQVCNIINKFLSKQRLPRRPGSGRKRKTTPEQDRKIPMDVKRNPRVSCREILNNNSNLEVSETTVRRRIVETGEFGSYYTTRKPFISKINRKKRLQWAKDHRL